MIGLMSVEELKQKMDSGEELILVDCREQEEWDHGNIEGAKFMPLSLFQEKFEELKDKNAHIVMQCRSGKRSMQACSFLQMEGYENLYNLEGGILAWQGAGYPINGEKAE